MKIRATVLLIPLALAGVSAAGDEEGLPPPTKKTKAQAAPPDAAPTAPPTVAELQSQVEVFDQERASLEVRIRKLESPGFVGILEGKHGASVLEDIFGEEEIKDALEPVARHEIATLESRVAVLGRKETATRALLADLQAKQAAAAAAAQAAAQEAAFQQTVNQAISNAANAWQPNGIVNANTGNHDWDMYCLALAATAWKTALGHDVPDFDADSAYHSYLKFAADGLVHTGGTPPRGAVVFWPAGASGFGHVAISNGDGTVVSNYTRSVVSDGINPSAAITDFGDPIGWVDPHDLK
ncbi:MAG TPA: CHAP domain-containing protein [Planctomycetota bacterium]|nr:CHAP domain-containing protein [Planctomycetota bacterium]